MVKWFAKLSDGKNLEGSFQDGSWRTLSETLNGRKITELFIGNKFGHGRIDSGKDGYFISNKMLVLLAGGQPQEFAGVGYWQRHDDMVRIKWYNVSDMQLSTTEARPTEECGIFLIKNPE